MSLHVPAGTTGQARIEFEIVKKTATEGRTALLVGRSSENRTDGGERFGYWALTKPATGPDLMGATVFGYEFKPGAKGPDLGGQWTAAPFATNVSYDLAPGETIIAGRAFGLEAIATLTITGNVDKADVLSEPAAPYLQYAASVNGAPFSTQHEAHVVTGGTVATEAAIDMAYPTTALSLFTPGSASNLQIISPGGYECRSSYPTLGVLLFTGGGPGRYEIAATSAASRQVGSNYVQAIGISLPFMIEDNEPSCRP